MRSRTFHAPSLEIFSIPYSCRDFKNYFAKCCVLVCVCVCVGVGGGGGGGYQCFMYGACMVPVFDVSVTVYDSDRAVFKFM